MDVTETWRLSFDFELIYSGGPGGDHTTSSLGGGRCADRDHLMHPTAAVGFSAKEVRAIIQSD